MVDFPTLRRMFRQKHPCSDCPFLKQGGARHGIIQVLRYAAYFCSRSFTTFPCHQSLDDSIDRSKWSEPQPGQTICAGGLIFANKVGVEAPFLKQVQEMGWYDPKKMEQRDKVFDTVEDLIIANREV